MARLYKEELLIFRLPGDLLMTKKEELFHPYESNDLRVPVIHVLRCTLFASVQCEFKRRQLAPTISEELAKRDLV